MRVSEVFFFLFFAFSFFSRHSVSWCHVFSPQTIFFDQQRIFHTRASDPSRIHTRNLRRLLVRQATAAPATLRPTAVCPFRRTVAKAAAKKIANHSDVTPCPFLAATTHASSRKCRPLLDPERLNASPVISENSYSAKCPPPQPYLDMG